MSYTSRNGKRWTTSEVLNLQREYELLMLSVEDIALRHQRSVDSILFKLQSEGLINSNKDQLEKESDADSSSDYQDEDEEDEEDKDEEDDQDDDDDEEYNDDQDDEEEEEDDDDEEYNEEEDDEDDDDSMPSLISIDDYDQYDNNDCVECTLDNLSDRIWSLETNVEEINTMVKKIFEKISSEKKSKKLTPLRKHTF